MSAPRFWWASWWSWWEGLNRGLFQGFCRCHSWYSKCHTCQFSGALTVPSFIQFREFWLPTDNVHFVRSICFSTRWLQIQCLQQSCSQLDLGPLDSLFSLQLLHTPLSLHWGQSTNAPPPPPRTHTCVYAVGLQFNSPNYRIKETSEITRLISFYLI